MAGGSKRSKRARLDDSESEDISDQENLQVEGETEDDEFPDGIEDDEGDSMEEDDGGESESEEEDQGDSEEDDDDEGDSKEEVDGESDGFEDGNDEESESDDERNDNNKDAEMEELEKEYVELRSQELDILKNLKRDKGEDAAKGQAVKNQKALWDKTLELRFLLQKSFSSSNRLPQEAVKSCFCSEDEKVSTAYTDLITSSKKTLDSLLELQEALFENNPSVDQQVNGTAALKPSESSKSDAEDSDEWQRISDLQKRMSVFRNKAVDKWQRRTQVTTGAAAIKGKLHAFNQNVSEQVASYMRDPSRMIKQMQQSRSTVAVFGTVPKEAIEPNQEENQVEGDPELVEDAEFYQQLLKEFFETIDPASSEAAFYAMKKFQTKKRKIVDRRASKCRKIRYNVHEKMVNFMAPRPVRIPPNTADLLKNLFGLKTKNVLSEA
uniref:Protein AATF n=1 Tax=Noccaea caerulescens TaxID=107243 RepID=A0A1J3K0N3_NOCCA